MNHSALLALADGSLFYGQSVGVAGSAVGEVVFNTSMTGYQEILTDPSYCRQLVTLTQPQIGNVGVNPGDEESSRIYAGGLIIKQLSHISSNWRAEMSLSDYLASNDVVAIANVDTRRLTRVLRDKGAQDGCILAGAPLDENHALKLAREFAGLQGMDLAREVTTARRYRWQEGAGSLDEGRAQRDTGQKWQVAAHDFGDLPVEDFEGLRDGKKWQVVAYDFGVKRNILRILSDLGCELEVVPAMTPAGKILAGSPGGVFLSNGPGDPEPCDYAIEAIGEIVASGVPVFGICLGHQLLALACGAKTVKMKFGHHGGNHPVQELATGKVMITSQNHGFVVDESSIPGVLSITHRSLFDGTVQGIRHNEHPAFGFQGHPEASPGPRDLKPLFDHFLVLMERN